MEARGGDRQDWFLAVDLGGTRLRVAVTDQGFRLSGRQEEATALPEGPKGVVGQIGRMVDRALMDAGVAHDCIRRVAVGSPGPLDAKLGVIHGAPNLTGWTEVPLKLMLEERLGLPVAVVNDANAAALAEHRLGAGRGARDFVYLTISTGIGGGVIVNGQLLEGASGTAGELGHTTIDRHGPVCKCGNIGCLEALASGTAIGKRFQQGLDAGRRSIASNWLRGEVASAADVTRAAQEGDSYALEVLTDAGEALGFGVLNCIHTFNPEVIALGGGVTRAGSLLLNPMTRIVERYAFPIPRGDVRIVPAELGDDVGLAGAACVAVASAGLTRELT